MSVRKFSVLCSMFNVSELIERSTYRRYSFLSSHFSSTRHFPSTRYLDPSNPLTNKILPANSFLGSGPVWKYDPWYHFVWGIDLFYSSFSTSFLIRPSHSVLRLYVNPSPDYLLWPSRTYWSCHHPRWSLVLAIPIETPMTLFENLLISFDIPFACSTMTWTETPVSHCHCLLTSKLIKQLMMTRVPLSKQHNF